MSSTFKWSATGTDRGNVLSTELNSLADAGWSAAGTELANQTNLDEFCDLVLAVTFGSNPSGTKRIDVYMVVAADGTNYEDGSDTVAPQQKNLIGSFELRASTSAQKLALKRIVLLPFKTKFLIQNKSGQSFPSSGSTIKAYTYNEGSP